VFKKYPELQEQLAATEQIQEPEVIVKPLRQEEHWVEALPVHSAHCGWHALQVNELLSQYFPEGQVHPELHWHLPDVTENPLIHEVQLVAADPEHSAQVESQGLHV